MKKLLFVLVTVLTVTSASAMAGKPPKSFHLTEVTCKSKKLTEAKYGDLEKGDQYRTENKKKATVYTKGSDNEPEGINDETIVYIEKK